MESAGTLRRRVGALDGLRGVAIIAVLAYHVSPSWFAGGYLGVEVFFVLSGFLVVSLLLDEHRATGAVRWKEYARRRLRRIGPALIAFLLALTLIAPLVARADSFRLRGDVFWSALGLTNWHLIAAGSSYFAQLGRPPLVRHLWSLAVEIQFYALCPLLLLPLLGRSRRVAAIALAAGVAASSLAMGLLYRSPDPSRAYYGTDARIGALLFGALLAVVLTTRSPGTWLDRASGRTRAAIGLAGVGTLVALFMFGSETARLMYPAGFLVCRIATAAVIWVALDAGPVAHALGGRVLSWFGTRSYSIYIWHWPLLALLRPRVDVGWPAPVAIGVALAGALLLGELSYRFVEQPYLRPRRSGRRRPALRLSWAVPAAVVAAAVVLVQLPTVDPISASLRAGAEVLASERAPSAPTTTTTSTTAPAPAGRGLTMSRFNLRHSILAAARTPPPPPAPVAPALPLGPPPGSVAVTGIGDSVMLGAAPALQARLGPSGYIDAKVSRQFAQGVDVARQLRDEGRLGSVVIIHLGTNGPPRASDIDAMMSVLSGVPHVLFVTCRMPRSWEAQTNQALHAAASRYPAVTLVDWYAYSDGHLDWFQSDGVHLKPNGAQAYATLLGSAIPVPQTGGA